MRLAMTDTWEWGWLGPTGLQEGALPLPPHATLLPTQRIKHGFRFSFFEGSPI